MRIVSRARDSALHFPNANFDVRVFRSGTFAETLAAYKTYKQREHFARWFQIRVANHGYVFADTFQEAVNLGRVDLGVVVFFIIIISLQCCLSLCGDKKAASSNRVWY